MQQFCSCLILVFDGLLKCFWFFLFIFVNFFIEMCIKMIQCKGLDGIWIRWSDSGDLSWPENQKKPVFSVSSVWLDFFILSRMSGSGTTSKTYHTFAD